jgi:hypothetical protein
VSKKRDRSGHFTDMDPLEELTVRPPLPEELLSDDERVSLWSDEEIEAEVRRRGLADYIVDELAEEAHDD